MNFSRTDMQSFDRGIEKEWLVTNGLGGFASSTIIGANARKYHGLLFAALNPPVDRRLLVAKLEEEVYIDNQLYLLGVNETIGGIQPHGFLHLQQFRSKPFPTYVYSIKDMIIEKTIFMVHGQNTTVINYCIYTPEEREVEINIKPMVNYRDYHHNTTKNNWPFEQILEDKGVKITPYPGAISYRLLSEKALYQRENGHWFESMNYAKERERGEYPLDSHYIPGYFSYKGKGNSKFSIIATIDDVDTLNGAILLVRQEKRLAQLVEGAGYPDEFSNRLILAADNFLVHRNTTDTTTIIAGYPWFTDWGRDTMIAFAGLTLITKRFKEAKEILKTFAQYCLDGLIPNTFPDGGGEPYYNTVDASMWYFYSVYKYLEYTADYDFIQEEIYPVLKSIIQHHINGTHFNIKMDKKDGLLSAGTRGVQLTWMDAKIDDWVVTPREGKAVEINALWYNALKTMEMLAKKYKDKDMNLYHNLATQVWENYGNTFWNEEEQCLYDVVSENKDSSIRPNQIIAVALPYPILDHSKEKRIVDKVWRHLYTTYGLRSLSPVDNKYIGVYVGDKYKRDGAYHQGTAWSWLMGPFITAYRKVNDYNDESRESARRFINPFKDHLREHGVGNISEIFDGNEPFTPRGCIAQAWGVAEILRAYVEDIIEIKPS